MKNVSLPVNYHFISITIETVGARKDEAAAFLLEFGRRVAAVTLESMDRRSTNFCYQDCVALLNIKLVILNYEVNHYLLV
jgi:hypothetical protein